MKSSKRLLLVEDELPLITLLQYNLSAAGYSLDIATDGNQAIDKALETKPDLILLDWMLPERTGISVCKTLRKHPTLASCPIIMVTARSDLADIQRGLEAGVDDYIIKPFQITDLLTKISEKLAPSTKEEGVLQLDDITYNRSSRILTRGSRRQLLDEMQGRLLEVLMSRPGSIFEKQELRDLALAETVDDPSSLNDSQTRKVSAKIKELRASLTAAGEPDVIKTIRGVGYALERA